VPKCISTCVHPYICPDWPKLAATPITLGEHFLEVHTTLSDTFAFRRPRSTLPFQGYEGRNRRCLSQIPRHGVRISLGTAGYRVPGLSPCQPERTDGHQKVLWLVAHTILAWRQPQRSANDLGGVVAHDFDDIEDLEWWWGFLSDSKPECFH
jgi:hypothetical protein